MKRPKKTNNQGKTHRCWPQNDNDTEVSKDFNITQGNIFKKIDGIYE